MVIANLHLYIKKPIVVLGVNVKADGLFLLVYLLLDLGGNFQTVNLDAEKCFAEWLGEFWVTEYAGKNEWIGDVEFLLRLIYHANL